MNAENSECEPIGGTPRTGDVRRRDFLNIAAVSAAGVGATAAAIPLIDSMNPSAGMINYSAMGNSGIGGISGIGVPVIQNPASNGSANRAAGNINNVGNPQPISGANSAMNGVPNAALNSAIPASARPSLAPNNPSTPPDFGASPPVVSNTPPIAH